MPFGAGNSKSPAVRNGGPAKGDPAPQVIGTNVDGVALESGQFRGKVLVVTFWATWCGPCMRELPMLESMQRLAGIGRDGTILEVHRGYSEESLDGILAEINAALKPPA
jgi:thiol-disulfide isomerase/thioredoxin